ncbi:MAG TPA: hypothetical protein VFV59_00560 [Candidatus Limnocylindria bacterium]|nr:hypothetical protein [Candidatus Limnocylindria bacterium]
MPKRTAEPPPDPDRLVRQSAGTYRTEDDRFEVRSGDTGWFVVDSEQTNEFGQELMHGPFATLKAAREAVPGARSPKVTALRRPRPRPRQRKGDEADAPPARRKPRTWLDDLATADARRARALIRALDRRGFTDADGLVRQDREGFFPVVAARLVEDEVARLVDDWPEATRPEARALVARVLAIVTQRGGEVDAPLPGWRLVEVPHDGAGEREERPIELGE